MRVLITGIGGFVGQRLARNLLQHGHRVSGTSQPNTPASKLEGVDLHPADLMDPGSLERAIHASQPDAVVHLAGLSSVGESRKIPDDYFRVNVQGTENLLAVLGDTKLVFASSAEVYGIVPEEEQPLREERAPNPCNPYGETKAAAERLVLERGAVVARAFNLVGPGQASKFAFPSFASQLAAIGRGKTQEAVIKVGNLAPKRDFVHVDDGAEAFRLLTERGRPGEIYNIASGQACSIGEALARLSAISGVRAEIQEKEDLKRDDDPPLFLGDNSRLRKLGWEPRRSLDQALSDLWEDVRGSAS